MQQNATRDFVASWFVIRYPNEKLHPLKVIPWLPRIGLYRNLGVIPGYKAVNRCTASDWHLEER